MLAQHVLPMRKSLTSESTSHTSSQVRDVSSVSEASVSSTGKHTVKEALSGARKGPKKPTQPAKRGRRLRTESWTISEDKALHAATAVADVILIPDQENIDSEDADSEVKENVDIIGEIDIEAELLEEKGIDEDMMDVLQEVMVNQTDAEKDITSQEKVKVKEDLKRKTAQKTEASLSEVKSKDDTENKVAAVKEQVSNSKISDNQISAKVTEATKGSEETVKPETVDSKELPTTQDERARARFDTSTESLRLVLENENQETKLDKSDTDKDVTDEGVRHSEIPTSDSMPELSKICEPPVDAVNQSNLPVPKLTPVKDFPGRPIVPQGEQASRSMEFSSKEAPVLDKVVQEVEESKDEEAVGVEGGDMTAQAVNSRLMADLTKSGAIHDNVVVLATWSVSSEDDVELDVTGTTGDSMEDDVIEPDADRLKKIVTGETGASNIGENENKVSEISAHEMETVLTDLKNRLDGILAEHVPVKDIEEEIVSDVREQIDDIVTAVELNESRDEEMSRIFEESPNKSVEEDIDEDIREQLDDIITAVELNEDNKEKEPSTSGEEKDFHEGNKEKEASEDKKEKSKDSLEEYLLKGHKSSKAGDKRIDATKETEAQKNAEVAKDKEAEKEQKDKELEESSKQKTKAAERQSSEDSER